MLFFKAKISNSDPLPALIVAYLFPDSLNYFILFFFFFFFSLATFISSHQIKSSLFPKYVWNACKAITEVESFSLMIETVMQMLHFSHG